MLKVSYIEYRVREGGREGGREVGREGGREWKGRDVGGRRERVKNETHNLSLRFIGHS